MTETFKREFYFQAPHFLLFELPDTRQLTVGLAYRRQ